MDETAAAAALDACLSRAESSLASRAGTDRAAAQLGQAELLLQTLEACSLSRGSAALERRRRRLRAAQEALRSRQGCDPGRAERAEAPPAATRDAGVGALDARQALLGGSARLQATGARLESASREAHEAEATGHGVLAALAAQREQLLRVSATRGEADEELSEAEKALRRMRHWSRRLLGLS